MKIPAVLARELDEVPAIRDAVEAFLAGLVLETFPRNRSQGSSFHQQLRHAIYYHTRCKRLMGAPDAGGWIAPCLLCARGWLIILPAEGWFSCEQCGKHGDPATFEYAACSASGPAFYADCAQSAAVTMAAADAILPYLVDWNGMG